MSLEFCNGSGFDMDSVDVKRWWEVLGLPIDACYADRQSAIRWKERAGDLTNQQAVATFTARPIFDNSVST